VHDFIPGLTLAERFYYEAVRPILDAHFPDLQHSAALIGAGSEVLGFDTPVSCDHHWGPRALLFLGEADHSRYAESVREALRQRLPHTFLGWLTNFAEPDPHDHGTQLLRPTTSGPVNHRVALLTIRGFCLDYLGFDPNDALGPYDWLTFPSQKLRTITGEGEHLMGRAGQVGDEIGSMLIAGRLASDVMRLCFLMERQHAPYAKWFGTAFAGLRAASQLSPLLWRVLRSETWPERDRTLSELYSVAARMQNALGVVDPLPADPRPFFARPFTVIFGERFADALKSRIDDARLRGLPFDIGGIDQWSDSTDLLEATALRLRLKALYGSPIDVARRKPLQ